MADLVQLCANLLGISAKELGARWGGTSGECFLVFGLNHCGPAAVFAFI